MRHLALVLVMLAGRAGACDAAPEWTRTKAGWWYNSSATTFVMGGPFEMRVPPRYGPSLIAPWKVAVPMGTTTYQMAVGVTVEREYLDISVTVEAGGAHGDMPCKVYNPCPRCGEEGTAVGVEADCRWTKPETTKVRVLWNTGVYQDIQVPNTEIREVCDQVIRYVCRHRHTWTERAR
jgi:hypothetical protein